MAHPGSFLFVLGLFASVALLNPLSCSAQQLFVFGDDLYAPRLRYLTDNTDPSASEPLEISTGKISRRIVPDYIAEFLGIPSVPSILNVKADFSHGASFAMAGATVLGIHHTTMNFSDQAKAFIRNKDKWSSQEREEALYLIYIGANDYLDFVKTHPDPTPEQQVRFVLEVTGQIKKVLKAIRRVGGRKFAFQNLAPLGCLPIMEADRLGCVRTLPSLMAAEHNQILLKIMEQLTNTLDGFQFSVFDYFHSVVRRIRHPLRYGYSERKVKKVTEITDRQMSQLMWSADPSVVQPVNLRELYVFPLGVPFEVVVGELKVRGDDGQRKQPSYYSSI